MYGRGACDTLGPLVSALWAMLALKRSGTRHATMLLEIVPGEEDCVGLGTLTSIARGYRADAAVVLEPTAGVPRCASRGGCRFEITASGRAVHGTVKWLGVDAIGLVRQVLAALEAMEQRWNDRSDALFDLYPLARPITPDRLDAGRWQGMVADEALCAGYLELLPGDDLAAMQTRFERELLADLSARGVDPARVRVMFSEVYAGHRTDPGAPLCLGARAAFEASSRPFPGWAAFNSGCEAGIRSGLHGTPTLVWGPGDLAHAHAVDERVDLAEVQAVAGMFAHLTGHQGLT
jgi:acetylornithine deacetylase